MKLANTLYFSAFLVAIGAASSCSSDSSGCADGGDAACTSSASDATDATDASDGPQLFKLPAGASCVVVTQVASGSVDGCGLEVANAAMTDPANSLPITIPINYDAATGIVTLGTDGALGGGAVVSNKATLHRVDSVTSLNGTPACTWHQNDTSLFELIADATFTIDVTEEESGFATACPASVLPATDPCTSTWRWTMTRSTKTPPCL